jgi:hypothetical protein
MFSDSKAVCRYFKCLKTSNYFRKSSAYFENISWRNLGGCNGIFFIFFFPFFWEKERFRKPEAAGLLLLRQSEPVEVPVFSGAQTAMFFKCGRAGCQFEAPTSKSVKMHQASSMKRKKQSNFSIVSQYKDNGAHGRCRGQGILCVNAISKSGKCLPEATVFHEPPNTPRLPSPARRLLSDSLEDCNADVDADSWTHNGQEAGASTSAGLYKPPALPLALALCSRVTEEQEKRWNTDEEHS